MGLPEQEIGAATLKRASLAAQFAFNLVKQALKGEIWPSDIIQSARWQALTRNLSMPIIVRSDDDDHTTLLELNGMEFWWPREYSLDLLSLVWAEVFVSFPPNAHAYEFGPCALSPGDVVVDAGACEGFFSAYALDRGCSVFAIEPLPRLCHCLNKTFAKQRESRTFTALNCLLSDGEGTGKVGFSSTPIAAKADVESGLTVPMRSIDSMRASGVLPRVDFIKMDIEGSEVAALHGAATTVARDRPALSLAAYHRSSDAQAFASVLTRVGGYQWWVKGRTRLRTELVSKVFHAVPIEKHG